MFDQKVFIYSLVLFSSLLFGCSESTSPEEADANLIPLKIGNTWSHNFTDYDSNGVVTSTKLQISTIDRDTTFSNKRWYSYSHIPRGVWFINKDGGYWSWIKASLLHLENDTSVVVYKYPTFAGDIYGDVETPTEVISIDEEITVPAGKFKVIHYVTRYISSDNYLIDSFEKFIAPGIGVIKTMQVGKKANGDKFIVYKRELESYSLK
ncbi:hypothetical protein MNBD_IGNAVI01-1010 [hydrothermal vent metagenome]|uniref:Uncharacterized protein n=1 Tax=hydrothermal vent metagenome TaxID=652676 RepID=A0A3B1D078_9ZZZZ